MREQKCVWLVVYCAQGQHFTSGESSIVAVGGEAGAQGVSIDNRRTPVSIGRFLLLPVCITRDATVGQWSIQIKTDVASASLEETIVTNFQVK
jgi:hypothetical protein